LSELATIARRHRAEVDLGHPVRSFALVMVGLGLVLLAVQWTGAVQPRITSHSGGEQQSGGTHRFSALIQNDAATSVRVTGVRWPATDGSEVVLTLGAPGATGQPGSATLPFEPFTLGPGDARVVSASLTPTCGRALADLEVRVRTAIGLTRTITLDGTRFGVDAAGCAPIGVSEPSAP
jgi:hypothetical protein